MFRRAASVNERLIYPINRLEAEKDKYGIWRSYVNQQLKQNYQGLYQRIDHWIMLKAPSFDSVHEWRLEQENKRQTRQDNTLHQQKETFMTSAEVVEFFERGFELARFTELRLRDALERDSAGFRQLIDFNRSVRPIGEPPTSLPAAKDADQQHADRLDPTFAWNHKMGTTRRGPQDGG